MVSAASSAFRVDKYSCTLMDGATAAEAVVAASVASAGGKKDACPEDGAAGADVIEKNDEDADANTDAAFSRVSTARSTLLASSSKRVATCTDKRASAGFSTSM